MSNFSYLATKPEYSLFASAAIEAEKVFATSPAMCAVGCRKALELAVKWVYAADKTITMPYKDNLQSLLHEESFRFAVDKNVWSVLPSIVKAGNLAVHTGHSVSAADAVFSLRGLFDFIQWVDYCYGTDYVESSFDETAIPGDKVELDTRKIREQESLLEQKDAELEALRKQVESLSAAYTAGKQQNQQCRTFTAADLTEAETRQKIIDIDLKAMGWKFTGADADVRVEYEVDNMNGVLGQKGYADYVLMGKDGKPLAVIEAKRSTKDPNIGRKQAQLYADCLEQKFGRRPMLFTTNGYTTYFWDEASGPQRPVSGVFCKDDLQKLMNRRTEKKPLDTIEIDDKITDRYYQKNAIRAVCAHITRGVRRNLLVMATGTGKTRTASSLTDVLSRGGHVTNVLFLADRIGKTIIFAQNKRHAEFIRERFCKLYPQLETQYPGFIQRVVCDDAYAQSIIDDFKQPDKPPFIAVSVDMMDTGINVPECVNLVFFKKVRSKTKFWQMIGRGTRLCPSLACVDAIDGEYTGKRRFLIFDYCGNFEFFRQKPNGYESTDTKSLSESIFCKQVRIAAALQDGAYADEKYQSWRNILTETCRAEVGALNPELVSVRLHRKAVEHYQKPEAFTALSETDKGTLMREVAPLISLDDKDEAAKRFDNFVYGLVLCELEGLPGLTRAQRQLKNTAALLEQKATIPQVQAKLPLIREVQTDEFLTSHDLLRFEEMRQELRELVKFLVDGVEGQKPIYTALADPVLEQTEGKALDSGYDFGEYRERVNRYIMEHRNDTLAIHKLTQNIPLSQGDYIELEHIFTSELGSKEDYAREFKDTPFGLLVRKVTKLDHEAAMQAFSKFINDESLNAKQIAFVQKVIHYIEQNGYVESKAVLMKPPFDQPILFTRLFDGKMGGELMETIDAVRENAVHVTA